MATYNVYSLTSVQEPIDRVIMCNVCAHILSDADLDADRCPHGCDDNPSCRGCGGKLAYNGMCIFCCR